MAQLVGYMQRDVEYKEGPFVVAKVPGGRFRIEVELKGWPTPAPPSLRVYELLANGTGRQMDSIYLVSPTLEEVSKDVDWLNLQTKTGIIKLIGRRWLPVR